MSSSNVERFAKRFAGYTKAHGVFTLKNVTPSGKSEGEARTVQEPPTVEKFQAHLDGRVGLGIIPLDDNECVSWACIDIDVIGIDLDALAKKVEDLKLPLLVCRSKSGGAHCYLFLSQPTAALPVRDYMVACAAKLGHSGVEVFPKQTERREGETGNWLNMPYFNAGNSLRYCHHKGEPLELDEFLDAADGVVVDCVPEQAVASQLVKGVTEARAAPTAIKVQQSAMFDAPKADDGAALGVLEREVTKVAEATSGRRNNELNRAAYTVGGLIGAGVLDEGVARERLLLAADEAGLPRREADKTISSGFKSGRLVPWTPSTILDPRDPVRTARKITAIQFTEKCGHRLIHRHREAFWLWDGARYVLQTKEDMRASIYKFTERAQLIGKNGPEPFKPTSEKVSNIYDALAATSNLNDALDAPAWIENGDDLPPPSEFAAVENGLLHLPTCDLWAPTPTFFNTAASGVKFDPAAPAPTHWLTFLDQIFGDDADARQALQEFVGYCLSTDTSQQKMLLLVGPPRSGKGTAARVLRELVGPDSVAGPTMSSLSGEFGLEPLIPRPIAIISDARIGPKTDKAAVTERLLAISGEDAMSVNRKGSSFWHGKLQTRFIMITNELPALSDGSGALANRFIIVLLKTSFLGKEDPALFERLKPELSGILNWAIDGYQRLRERGHFVQPQSAAEALEEMMRIGSPVRAFVTECCEVGADYTVDLDYLWDKWNEWARDNGNMIGSKSTFGKNLRTVIPGLARKDRGHHDYYYAGLRVSMEYEDNREKKEKEYSDNIPF